MNDNQKFRLIWKSVPSKYWLIIVTQQRKSPLPRKIPRTTPEIFHFIHLEKRYEIEKELSRWRVKGKLNAFD